MSNRSPVFTPGGKTGRDDWETPPAFYARLDEEFHFAFDPCPHNPTFDGLSVEWKFPAFVNPPYRSKDLSVWTLKCREEGRRGTVVALLPVRTGVAWWHDNVQGVAKDVRFLRGRLRFVGSKWSAPFDSCVVIWRPGACGR